MLRKLRAYYILTKPGIIRGNIVHVVAGGLLASIGTIQWAAIGWVVLGTSLVIASACIANNYLDRDMDAKMKRTKKRPSVTGQVSVAEATTLSVTLAITGFAVLALQTNLIVVAIGAVAYFSYVVAYGWAKRHTIHSTVVGAIPGALPAMAGYVAVSGSLGLAAWLLFLLVFIWQMPHFYAISLFRKTEYAAASVPVLGVVKPFETVRMIIGLYMVLYLVVAVAMTAYGVFHVLPGILLALGGIGWLGVFVFKSSADHSRWATAIFGVSLLLTLLLLTACALNVFLR